MEEVGGGFGEGGCVLQHKLWSCMDITLDVIHFMSSIVPLWIGYTFFMNMFGEHGF